MDDTICFSPEIFDQPGETSVEEPHPASPVRTPYLVSHGGGCGVVTGRGVRVLVAHRRGRHLVVALRTGAGLVGALGRRGGVGRVLLCVVPAQGNKEQSWSETLSLSDISDIHRLASVPLCLHNIILNILISIDTFSPSVVRSASEPLCC